MSMSVLPILGGDDYQRQIIEAAYAHGVSPAYMLQLSKIESGNNRFAKNPNSSATGPFQFVDRTWMDEMGKAGNIDPTMANDPEYRRGILDQRTDPSMSAKMAAQYAQSNQGTLSKTLGRNPQDAEMYMGHLLGPAGARTFFEGMGADGNAPAHENLPIAADANKQIFFNSDGSGRSYNDVMKLMSGKFPMTDGQSPLADMGFVPPNREPVPAIETQPVLSQPQPAPQTATPDVGNRRDNAMLAEGLNTSRGDPEAARMFLNIGAGFLGGDGFWDGASKAASGASRAMSQNSQAQQARTGTFTRLVAAGVDPQVARRAAMTGDLSGINATTMASNSSQQGTDFYTPKGEYVKEVFNKRNGKLEYHNATTGETLTTLPSGSFRTASSPFKEINKASGEDINNAYTNANAAGGRIEQLNRLQQIGQGITGPDLLSRAGRGIAEALGMPIGQFDPANISQFKRELADMAVTASQRLRGQGQITESERRLLIETLPAIDTNPQAFRTVINILKSAEQRKVEQVQAWEGSSSEDKKDGWQAFQFRFRSKLERGQGDSPQETPQRGATPSVSKPSSTSTGVKWQLKP